MRKLIPKGSVNCIYIFTFYNFLPVALMKTDIKSSNLSRHIRKVEPETRDPCHRWDTGPETRDPKNETRDPRPGTELTGGTGDPRPKILNVGPEARDPVKFSQFSLKPGVYQ